jgi:hypothetical protein
MQEVKRVNLVPGKEYYIQCFAPGYLPPNKPYKMIGKFEQLSQGLFIHSEMEFTCFTNFRTLEHRNNPSLGKNVQLVLHWKFYEINVPTIQKNMENRAYNMVLLDIVKDEYFKPIEVI